MRRILLVLSLLMLLLAPVPAAARPAAQATAYPEVYDCAGNLQPWEWMQSHFGHVTYHPVTDLPHFRLARLDCAVGPATITVRVLYANGQPAYNQPVILSWPGISYDPAHPDPNIRPLSGYKSIYAQYGITQRTDTGGFTGFGMSPDWYYRDGYAPGIVWVGSPSTYSDYLDNVGMLGGTVHETFHLTFVEVLDAPPAPTPAPSLTPAVTPGPTPTPGPPPTPPPGNDGNTGLNAIAEALNRLADIFGWFLHYPGTATAN
jgi:hypothetical protein